jgi:hypothetical protein
MIGAGANQPLSIFLPSRNPAPFLLSETFCRAERLNI